MKPTKNYFSCGQCNKRKIRFDTQNEALRFIDYNSEEIREKNGYAPIRAYYCRECNCWHLTSTEYAYYTRKNPLKMRHYDLAMDKAAKADNRLLVKELSEMLHKINRYIKGHDAGETHTDDYYIYLLQKVKTMYDLAEGSLTKSQREKICHRMYEIKMAYQSSRTGKEATEAQWKRRRRKTHTLRSHRHGLVRGILR